MNTTQQLQTRANQAPGPNTSLLQAPGTAPQRLLPRRSSGWDPFEVWSTRVRPPRDPMQPAWEPRR